MARQVPEKLRVLVIDGESPFAEYAALALGQDAGMRVFVLSAQGSIPLRLSNRIHKLIRRTARGDEAMLALLRAVVDENRIDLVMAGDVPAISFLSRNLGAVTSFVRCAAVPSSPQLEMASDKWLTASELSRLNIPIPHTMLLAPEAAEVGFPMLVKPRQGQGGQGIFVVRDQVGLETALHRLGERAQEYVAQSFIAGTDVDCSVLCRSGVIRTSTVQRPANRGHASFEPPEEIVIGPMQDVSGAVGVMFQRLGWNGIAHVDLRRASDGALYVIEINPRYWASLPGSVAAGVNFVRMAVLDGMGESFPVPEYKEMYYCEPPVWLKTGGWKKPLPLPAPIRLKLSDPLPTVWRGCLKLLLIAARSFSTKGNNRPGHEGALRREPAALKPPTGAV